MPSKMEEFERATSTWTEVIGNKDLEF